MSFLIAGFVMPSWLKFTRIGPRYLNRSGYFAAAGLWGTYRCDSWMGTCSYEQGGPWEDKAWFRSTQVLATLGIICSVAGSLILLYITIAKEGAFRKAITTFFGLTGLLTLVAVVIFVGFAPRSEHVNWNGYIWWPISFSIVGSLIAWLSALMNSVQMVKDDSI